jgi:Zn-dependent peptidase ImmA (M78 family)
VPTKVDISPNIIQWALDNSNISKDEIKKKFAIDEWLAGTKKPTINQLNSFSGKLRIPFGYFFLQNPPQEDISIIRFRTINNDEIEKPSRELVDTYYNMRDCQTWMHDFLKNSGWDKLEFVGVIQNADDESVALAVKYLSEYFDLNIGWNRNLHNSSDAFKFLRNHLERAGIIVMQNSVVKFNNNRKLNIDEFRAFTLIDDYAPLIFLNASDSNNGKIFSLIHEAVHILLGIDSLFNDNHHFNSDYLHKKLEQFCNKVTAHFLIPTNLFNKEWEDGENWSTIIKNIADKYNLSPTVIGLTALHLNYISGDQFQQIYNDNLEAYKEYILNKKSGESRGNYYNNFKSRYSSRLTNAVMSSVEQGNTQYTDAYNLLGISRKVFDTLSNESR